MSDPSDPDHTDTYEIDNCGCGCIVMCLMLAGVLAAIGVAAKAFHFMIDSF